jgi:hypothetical protein
LPVPSSDTHVHLTVFTPGGAGTKIVKVDEAAEIDESVTREPRDSKDFVGADKIVPGSGTYVELDVPYWGDDVMIDGTNPEGFRTWRWPVIE